jgi:hypothetical protein
MALRWQTVGDIAAFSRGSIGTSALRMPRRWDLAGLIGGKVIFVSWAIVIPLLVYPWWAVTATYVGLSMLTSVVMAKSGSRFGTRLSCVLLTLVAVTMGFNGVAIARDRLAFQMHALEQRYRTAGIVVRDRLPPGAAVLTTWDSGAVRFHGRREAIVWDALDPAWLDRALAWLSQHGHQPFILVESWEEPRFRARFDLTIAVLHDRASVYEGLGLEVAEGLANEERHGREVIFAPGFADGVAQFERRSR